ncbi:MAG: hypothetical protein E7058_01630 [Lentisphaerae bacterium]|nr:hypothetical protein [Lentisphaerota bacterium]
MQKIRSILKIGSSGAVLCDSYGSESGISLELMLGTGGILEFELRTDTGGESAVLPDLPLSEVAAANYYFAMDITCANSDDPALLIFNGVTVGQDSGGHTVVSVPVINNSAAGIAAALERRTSAEFFCEIGGFDAAGTALFAWQFPVTVRSRVYLGGGTETEISDPAFYTAVQVDALIAALKKRIDDLPAAAENIPIADDGENFSAENVEDALQELYTLLNGTKQTLETI